MTQDTSKLSSRMRERLAAIPDPLSLLEGLFAHSPVPYMIFTADGHPLICNDAYRTMFGREPPPEYDLLRDEVVEASGVGALVRRALAGETVQAPTVWYDPKQLQHIAVSDANRVAIACTFFPLRSSSGQVTHLAVAYKDLTRELEALERLKEERARLEASEAEFRAMFDLSAAGMSQADPETGRLVRVNDMMSELTGYSAEELLQLRFSDITHPDDRAADLESFQRMVRQQCPTYSSEKRYVRKDGRVIWVQVTAALLTDGQGHPRRTVAVVIDVTERKRAQERTLAITDNATSGLLMMDQAQQCVFMNPAAEQILGFTLPELQGRTLHDVVHHKRPDGSPYPIEECPIDRALPRQTKEQGEDVFVRKDGTFYPVAFAASPIVERGATTGTVIELRDLTREKAAEAAIREKEQLFRDLVENLPGLAWSAEPDGVIDFYNRRWYEYTGTDFEIMQRNGWAAFHDPELLPGVVALWGRSLEYGEPFEMEFPLRGRDGQYRWFLTKVTPLRDGQGRIVRWFGVNTDIDEERRARAEREQLVAELQRALEVRDEFMSIASHELRTPLTALVLQLQRIERQLSSGDADLDRLSKKLVAASRQTDRLGRLIQGLLDVSRISLGQLTLELEEVDLADVARDMIERHEVEIQLAHCTVASRLAEGARGRWDRLRIEQVAMNLLSNAIKYGAGKPVELTVWVEGGKALLSVRDQGIGVAPDDQQRIFGRFERAVPIRNYGGLGLGLYIAQQIVQAHEGQIHVESAPGQGSTFTVILPLAPTGD